MAMDKINAETMQKAYDENYQTASYCLMLAVWLEEKYGN